MTTPSASSCAGVDRCGLTIVEVLVAAGVLALLAGIVLPALHAARESSRRLQCVDHLRQLSLAVQSHAATHGTQLPPTTKNAVDARTQQLMPSGSPHRHLLPYLDQAELFSRLDFNDLAINRPGGPPEFNSAANNHTRSLRLAVFLCPSDVQRPGATNYRANLGYGPGVFGPEPPAIRGYAGNVAGAFVHGEITRFGDFRDGTSQTILFSEKILGDGIPDRFTPWADYFYFGPRDISTADDAVSACGSLSHPNPPHASHGGWTWLFGGWNSTWYNHVLPPNSPIPDCSEGGERMAGGGDGAYTARSFHPGGVNAALADGSARFISSTIDLSVWRALSTRAGDDAIGDF
uniref:DUF1559 domain-containing protein n=1 Tax=Schlesneria paludicola TaxID=360056 RepID=A0A7C4LLC6_9PLAN